ncbi:MAG: hypothetical protein ACK5LC_03790 [Coprobacillaceae bacterium]
MTKKIALLLAFVLAFSSTNMIYANENLRIIDITPPVITDIVLDKTVVEVGTTSGSSIQVSVMASDDISGIDFMFVQFYNADYDKTITTYLDYDENTDLYIGHIDINGYALPGTYYINYAYARDYAGNEIIYSESYDNLNFMTNFVVINDVTDNVQP